MLPEFRLITGSLSNISDMVKVISDVLYLSLFYKINTQLEWFNFDFKFITTFILHLPSTLKLL